MAKKADTCAVKGRQDSAMFRAIKDTYAKSEAAVVVQNLLEIQVKKGFFDQEPKRSANDLVEIVWYKSPDLFDGRFGQRPNKVSLAAAAFENAMRVLGIENANAQVFAICLGNIIQEISVNGYRYPLNSLDEKILSDAARTLANFGQDYSSSPMGDQIARELDEVEDGDDDE